MGLLNIVGRLDLNAVGFKTGLENAEKQAERFASSTGKKMLGVAGGLFGINAMKRLAGEALESASNISRMADKFNLTTTEVQRLLDESERTGTSFEELVKNADDLEKTLTRLGGNQVLFSPEQIGRMRDVNELLEGFKRDLQLEGANLLSNPFLLAKRMLYPLLGTDIEGTMGGQPEDPKAEAFRQKDAARERAKAEAWKQKLAEAGAHMATQDRVLKIEEQIEETRRKNRLQTLTDEEKLAELAREREEIFNRIAVTQEERAQKELDLAKNETDLISASGVKTGSTFQRERAMSPLSDSLSSVGNFLGANPNAETRTQLSEANRTLKSMDRKLAELRTAGGLPL